MTGRRPVVALAAMGAVAALLWPAVPSYAASSTAVRGPQAEYGRLARPRSVDVRRLAPPGKTQRHKTARLLVPDQTAYANSKRVAKETKSAPRGTPFAAAPKSRSNAPAARAASGTSVQPTALTTFAGVSKGQLVAQFGQDQNGEPPDPQIAAGPDALLEMVNASGAVWSKSGSLIKLFDLNALYSVPVANGSFFSDPRVIYDVSSGRFVASGMALQPTGGAAYIAMSQTTDPAGSWNVYTLVANTAGVIYDQPKVSASTDKLVVTWFDYSCAQDPCSFQGTEAWVIQKSDVAAGASAPHVAHFPPALSRFGLIPAVELSAASTAYLLYPQLSSLQVVLINGTPAANDVGWTEQSNNVSPGDNVPPDAEQPDGAPDNVTGDDRFVSAVWRNGLITATSTVRCSFQTESYIPRSCLSYALVPTITFPPQPVQSGTFGEPGAYVYYPAVSLDGDGNPIFVFTESSIHMYPTVVALTLAPSATGLALHPGAASYDSTGCEGTNRWGDYSGASTDPQDATQVWIVGEDMRLSTDACDWGTTIAAVRFTPAPKVTALNPDAGSTAGGTPVTISGTHLSGATSVTFGTVPASGYTVDSDIQITATSPPSPGYDSAAFPVRVVVNTPGGSSNDPMANTPLFTYNAPTPVIDSVSPTNGSTAGGTVLTIAGTGFTAAMSVGFGNPDSPGTLTRVLPSNFLSITDTQIVVPAPARPPATVDVVVTTAGGARQNVSTASDKFTFVSPSGGAPGSVRRVAGGGIGTGPATAIGHYPTSVALSGSTLYIADSGASSNFRYSAIHAMNLQTGNESVVAGTGLDGFSGDGGPASAAQISGPLGMVVDGNGNLYFIDSENNRIRKIATNGVISTVTTLTRGVLGSGASGLGVDSANNIYVADSGNNVVRRIDAVSGAITTVAGNGQGGFSGDGGPATSATVWFPTSVFVDSVGNLLISDYNNARVRRVDHTTHIITTVAGSGNNNYSGDGGPAVSAGMAPMRVYLNGAGDLYILDSFNEVDRVRKVDHVTQVITTVAGTGVPGYNGDGIAATTAKLYVPQDILVDGSGNLYIADTFNYRVRRVGSDGIINTIAGNGRRCGSAGDNGPGTDAQLCTPLGVVTDASGNLYIADADNNRIRKLASDGTITSIAGTGAPGFSGDGSWAVDATLNHPTHLAMDADRQLFVADSGNQRIRMIDPTGIIHTVAGNGTQGFSGDGGPALSAQFNNPTGLAVDPAGRLYVADTGNHRIRRVSRFEPRSIETYAGDGAAGFGGDGGPSTQAHLDSPQGLAVSANFDVYIADTMNGRIRRAQADGRIFTAAGNPTSDFTEQVLATDARLSQPIDVAFRPGSETLIIADLDGVKEVARDGTLVRIAGGGFFLQPWDDGPAVGMPLPQVSGITFDPAGKLFFSSLVGNHVYRSLPPDLPSFPLALSATAGTGSATISWVTAATGGGPVIRYDVRPFLGAVEQPTTVVRGNGSTPPTHVTINGLRHSTYTFLVIATTPAGAGSASQSNAVTPITAPGPPTAVNALAADGSAIVSWHPPEDDGGSPITGYTITSSPPGGVAGTLGKTTSRVRNLTNGSSYSFIIQAINAVGTGESTLTAPVTPFSGGTFHPLAPVRILDTRNGTGGFPRAPLGENGSLDVQVTGTANIPSSGVSAVVMNVTVTDTTAASYLTLYPTGVSRPTASNLNWTPGRTVPNLVEVAVGRFGRVTVFNAKGSANVIFDVAGWVGVADNSRGRDGLFNPLAPFRILDTRDGTGNLGVPTRLGPGGVIHVLVGGQGGVPFVGGGVPFPGASAAVLNVTAADGTEPSYLTVYPRDDPRPVASNVNFVPRQAVPNRVIVKLGVDGQVDIYNAKGTVSVIVDLAGWFTDSSSTQGGSFFTGITPSRLLDTRDGGGPLGPNETGVLNLTGPGAYLISAVVLNVTVANPSQSSYLTVWPDGSGRPVASDLNFTRGLVVPNLVVVKMGVNAGIDFYNAAGSTDVIVDIVGYYGAAVAAPSSVQLSQRALKRVSRSRE